MGELAMKNDVKTVRRAAKTAASGPSTADVPRPARPSATREKLIAAATAGFAREGYEGYSSRRLSTDSTIHHGLIAYHFGGKLGLWQACLTRLIDDLRQHLADRQPEAADDTTRLKIIFEEFIRFNARYPEFQALMIDAAGRSDGRFEWVMTTMGHGAHESWKSLIAKAQAAGRFVEGDPGMLLNVFLGAATRMYVMAPEVEFNLERSPFDPAFVDAHVRTCLDLFFRP